jgi:hypothetical protein
LVRRGVRDLLWSHDDVVVGEAATAGDAAATTSTVVAFEVDDYDSGNDDVWSVLVQGVAQEIADSDEVAEMRTLPPQPLPTESG